MWSGRILRSTRPIRADVSLTLQSNRAAFRIPAMKEAANKPANPSPVGESDLAARTPVSVDSRFSRTFEALGNRNFRMLWIGLVLAMGGVQMQMAARGILVYDLTGEAVLTGVVTLGFAPSMLILSLFGGAVGDRFERRTIVQGTQAGGAILAAVLAVLITIGMITWVHLLIASILQGAMFAFQMPARQAMIPRMVGKAQTTNAVSLNAVGMSLMTMGAPAVGGLLYGFVGPAAVYYAIAALYGSAVVVTGMIPKFHPDPRAVKKSVFSDIKSGLVYVNSRPLVKTMLIYAVAVVLLSMPFRMLTPVFAKDVYGAGPVEVGILIGVAGVGGLIGSLGVAGLRRGQKRGLVLVASAAVSGLVMFIIASVPIYVVGVVAMIGIGFGESIRWTLSQSLAIEETGDEFRARVMSLLMMTYGLMPLGVLPVSYSFDRFGAEKTVAGLGIILLAVTFFYIVIRPTLRKMP